MKLAKILARRLNALDGETSSMARYICSFTTRRSPMDFAALKQLAGIVKRVEGSKNKLVDLDVAKGTPLFNAVVISYVEELSPNSGSIEEGIDGIEATIKRIATPALLDAILEKLGGDLQLDEDASSLF